VDAYHTPVLLKESIDGLDIRPGGVYVDVTFGGGGHSREIMRRLTEGGRLYAFDQDEDAYDHYKYQVENDSLDEVQFTFVRSNFRYLKNFLRYYHEPQADGILADLGVSSHHFDESQRGFSFRFDGPLDMRMNQRASRTAADVVNTFDERQLSDIFYLYGELRQSRRLAAAIVAQRRTQPITTIQQLRDVVEPFCGRDREKKDLARVFQALRIEVNQEMDALREMLQQATEVLRTGGRLSIITYHSLEDRIVKNLMKTGNCEGREDKDFFGRVTAPFRLVNSRVITPSAEEQERNPRSRSAKLRIAEKV
jgi:16S rRNA (cytosine1402-N4)-methyltransferase